MIDKEFPVIILCGGKGTRIADIAENIPKPMVPIGGKPILWHIMRIYAAYGFKNFILALGHRSWEIKNFFLNYRAMNSDFSLGFENQHQVIDYLSPFDISDWHITFAETGEETQTGMRVKLCRQYVQTPYFMVTYGDGLADINIDSQIRFHINHGKTATVTCVRPKSRFGSIELGSLSQVKAFNEKPDAGGGTINGGFFVFNRSFFDILDVCGDVMLERDPMDILVQRQELYAYLHDGFWEPMDTSREHRVLNQLWNEGNAPWKIW